MSNCTVLVQGWLYASNGGVESLAVEQRNQTLQQSVVSLEGFPPLDKKTNKIPLL